jgi:acetyltransferase-like isoleucine patch superfamily enzyme
MREPMSTTRAIAPVPGRLRPLARALKRYLIGWQLFVAFLVGRIPSHYVRLFLYRHVFHIAIGRGSAVHWRARFYAPARVVIGDHTIIGYDAFLDGRYSLTIGNNVNLGGEVAIFTAEHDPNSTDFRMVGGPVTIGDYAYIGTRVTILPGVRIGEGAVVATGAVVSHDIEPYTIVGGVPAKYIKDRRRDLSYQLDFRMPLQ